MSSDSWKHFLGGHIGGIFGLSLAYPLDTVKVRMQTRPAGTYSGIVNCIKITAQQEGVAALYRGLASPVIGYGLIKSTAFGSYNQMKGWITESSRSPSSSSASPPLSLFPLFLCGAYAGLAQTFVRAPVEQIKVVMQARNRPGSSEAPYSSTFSCLREVIKTEGVKVGLYRSLWPTLSREIPQYAIYYPTYEFTRRLFLSSPTESVTDLHPLATAFSGGVAGVMQWVPTYSLDVVKSRVSAGEPGKYKGLVDCAKVLYREEGISVFFRGLSAAVVRAFPLHGAVFLGYEMTMKFIK